VAEAPGKDKFPWPTNQTEAAEITGEQLGFSCRHDFWNAHKKLDYRQVPEFFPKALTSLIVLC